MEAKQHIENVLLWLKENNIDISDKRIRTYNYKGEWEVRIYNEPMEFPNTKKSRRKMAVDENGNNSTYGIHSRKISTYTHINETDMKSESERDFILEMLRS